MSQHLRWVPLALAVISLVPAVSAAKSKPGFRNCTGDRVRICAYDKTDIVYVFNRSELTLSSGEFGNVLCDSNSGCRVAVLPSSENCTKDTVKFDISTTHDDAYYIKKTSGGAYDLDKASGDPRFFDRPENQKCPGDANKPDLSFSVFNCAGRKLNMCVYNNSQLKASLVLLSGDATLPCGNPNSCTIIFLDSCPQEQPKNNTLTLRERAAYWVTWQKSILSPYQFTKASSDVNFFKKSENKQCPSQPAQ